MSTQTSEPVDVLILGAGWTSTFLVPLCNSRGVSYATTSRPSNPKPDTIPFTFDENDPSPDPAQFAALPSAKTVLITFPIKLSGASERFVRLYEQTHQGPQPGFIQLGSTGMYETRFAAEVDGKKSIWLDRHSPYNTEDKRGAAEQELLDLSPSTPTTVLDLAGLWGGTRFVRNFIARVAPNKAKLKSMRSVHMVHGLDVARAILAIHEHFDRAVGQRWILTDMRVYDWWDLAAAFGDGSAKASPEDKGPQAGWVMELMKEEGVRGLPRAPEQMGRALDSREFWDTFELEPVMARLE